MFQKCKNEYLCKYILFYEGDTNNVVYEQVVDEHANGSSSNVNLTSYCIGEEVKDSGFYAIQASVDDGETWVDLYEDKVYIKSQYSKYSVTSISPSVFYVPGTQLTSIVSSYYSSENATTYELLVVTNGQNYTYDINKSITDDSTILISSHSWFTNVTANSVHVRANIVNENMSTDWLNLNLTYNAVLKDVQPKIIWLIDDAINQTYDLSVSHNLPMRYELDIEMLKSGELTYFVCSN